MSSTTHQTADAGQNSATFREYKTERLAFTRTDHRDEKGVAFARLHTALIPDCTAQGQLTFAVYDYDPLSLKEYEAVRAQSTANAHEVLARYAAELFHPGMARTNALSDDEKSLQESHADLLAERDALKADNEKLRAFASKVERDCLAYGGDKLEAHPIAFALLREARTALATGDAK